MLLFPNCVMYYRKRAFSAAQVGVQMEKILLHPIKGQLRPIRGALQGRGIRGDHLAGKMQKFRRQHGVVDLRDRLPLRRSRPSLYQWVQGQHPVLGQGTVPCFIEIIVFSIVQVLHFRHYNRIYIQQ